MQEVWALMVQEAWLLLLFLPLTAVMGVTAWRLARRADKSFDREEIRKRVRIWPVPPTSL